METRTDVLNAEQIWVGLATALTFDDVLLVPRHSTVLPSAVDVTSQVTRNIRVNVGLSLGLKAAFVVMAIQHGGNPAQYGPAGGLANFKEDIEIVSLKALRGYLKAFAGAVYQNPKSICPRHQMLLPRIIRG